MRGRQEKKKRVADQLGWSLCHVGLRQTHGTYHSHSITSMKTPQLQRNPALWVPHQATDSSGISRWGHPSPPGGSTSRLPSPPQRPSAVPHTHTYQHSKTTYLVLVVVEPSSKKSLLWLDL